MKSNYYELQIKINPAIEDIVSDICFENLPCEGIVLAEETYKDLEIIATTEGTLKIFLSPSICCLEPKNLNAEEYIKNLLSEQRQLLKSRGFTDEELGSWDYTLEAKENEDWAKKWKEKWDITHVTDRITVVPDWLEYSAQRDDEVIIRLEPGCAFGTGTHQTTQLCMKAIEKYMKPGDEVADIGTGSGILAICAMKFGAKCVYGCDNDETVIDVAKENARKNSVDCTFELKTPDQLTAKYDFVMANILHNVLAEIMGDLKNIMKNGAYLSLSGILDEKKTVVLEAIRRENLQILEEIHQDQWTSFVVKNFK